MSTINSYEIEFFQPENEFENTLQLLSGWFDIYSSLINETPFNIDDDVAADENLKVFENYIQQPENQTINKIYYVPTALPEWYDTLMITKEQSYALTDQLICDKIENCINSILNYYSSNQHTFNIIRDGTHSWYVDSVDLYLNFSIKIYKISQLNQYCIERHRFHYKIGCILWDILNENLESMFSLDYTNYNLNPDEEFLKE